jgi:hypothetical protein
MDQDRKYRQSGYMDSDRERTERREQKPKPPQGPRSMQDANGPRLPRLVQSVTASRCFNCATVLPVSTDFNGRCPKCESVLHCCKQCSSFEPSTRFQCVKPIPARIPYKDQLNECTLFSARVTVMRDSPTLPSAAIAPLPNDVRTPSDARSAFDNLFKK